MIKLICPSCYDEKVTLVDPTRGTTLMKCKYCGHQFYMSHAKYEDDNWHTLMIQYSHNGETWEIWTTEETDLQAAWDEMDEKYTKGGHIFFADEPNNFLVVNGGFDE